MTTRPRLSSTFASSRRALVMAASAAGLSLLAVPALAQSAAPATSAPAAVASAPKATNKIKLATSAGEITVELYGEQAPKSVANFLQYVKDKHYDGTVFHRVIDGFMIQGGGFTPDLKQKDTRAPIPLESGNGLKNERGTLAMARTNNPNSATSQFFINVANNARLDGTSPGSDGYAVFGKVTEGMDVVDKIKASATTTKGQYQNVPLQDVVIQSATLVK